MDHQPCKLLDITGGGRCEIKWNHIGADRCTCAQLLDRSLPVAGIPALWNYGLSIRPEHAILNGSCRCWALTFEVTVDLTGPDACLYTVCRKHPGRYFVQGRAQSAVAMRGEANCAPWDS